MASERNQYSENERFTATAISSGSLVTGSTSIILTIQREYDGYYWDFGTSSFASSGWTSSGTAMTELDATGLAGVYYYDWNCSAIGTQASQRNYFIRANASYDNMPQEGYLKLGGWVDQINSLGGVIQQNGVTLKALHKTLGEVWQVKLKNGETAEDVLLTRSEFDASKDIVMIAKDDTLEKLIKSSIESINIPEYDDSKILVKLKELKPYDYSKIIEGVGKKIDKIDKKVNEKVEKPDYGEIKDEIEIIKEQLKIVCDDMCLKMDAHKEMMSEEMKGMDKSEDMECLKCKLEEMHEASMENTKNLMLKLLDSKFQTLGEFMVEVDYIKGLLETIIKYK